MVAAVLLCVAAVLVSPGMARAADCSLADYGYNEACGPQFETPAWGDGAGWTDPSKYATIQLADLTGNGIDELIARNDDGIEIWRFDTTVGQWRPAIDASGQPEVLTDFRSPLPSESGPNWTQAPYYSTIQTVDLSGNGAHEIIARFPSGIRVYKYTPPAGSKSIDGGTWSLVSQNGPFSDADGYTDPSLYLSIHAASAENGQPAALVAQSKSGVVVYEWNGSGWTKESVAPVSTYTSDPSQYLDLQWASLPTSSGVVRALIQRGSGGVSAQSEQGGRWLNLVAAPNPGPFGGPNPTPQADCPFTSGSSNLDCFDSSPSYYETLRFGDIIGDSFPNQREMLGRASDGLRVWQLSSDGTRWQRLATLTALRGGSDLATGRWASIRLARILDTKAQQVLALDGSGLQAWTYNAQANSWAQVTPSAPLNLGGKMWDTDPAYYSTIQTGDVTGSGHDAVIARGPYGIRTWFYDLHGNSGWTSYLPQDTSSYPQFTGGQAAAFAALTSQAKSHGAIPVGDGSVRDFWTGENAPDTAQLDNLESGILAFAGCSGGVNGGPPFQMCTPPAGTSGFAAADWTNVINETLAEVGMARSADDFFTELDTLRQKLFLVQGAELDAIASNLGLQGAAGNETTLQPGELAATMLRLAGALADEVPGAGPTLEVAAELVGLMTSSSPTLTSEFNATYADLKDKFATALTEVDKGLAVQSQEMRQSYGMLRLVSQLRAGNGAWSNPDAVGMGSVNAQSFALWVYKQLLPTMYNRYVVSNCRTKFNRFDDCFPAGQTLGVVDGGTANFTALAPPGYRCWQETFGVYCDYTKLSFPNDLAGKLFGDLSSTCNYQPGNANTAWTYACNLGVNPESSVGLAEGTANGWDFANNFGNPCYGCASVSRPAGQIAIGHAGRVRLTGALTLPKGFGVKSASVDPARLLYQAGPMPRLVYAGPGERAAGPLALAVHTGAPTGKSAPAGGPSGQLSLGRGVLGQRRFSLSVTGVRVGVPAACRQLRAADALATPAVALSTVFMVQDQNRSQEVSVPSVWRCVRDRAGVITGLAPAVTRRVAQRSGLALSLAGPRAVSSGARLTYAVRVRNRRRGPRNRLVSSLWHVLVRGTLTSSRPAVRLGSSAPRSMAAWRLFELRRGQSRTLRLHVQIPRSATGRVCLAAVARADSARAASTRLCTRLISPRASGLG